MTRICFHRKHFMFGFELVSAKGRLCKTHTPYFHIRRSSSSELFVIYFKGKTFLQNLFIGYTFDSYCYHSVTKRRRDEPLYTNWQPFIVLEEVNYFLVRILFLFMCNYLRFSVFYCFCLEFICFCPT